MNRGDSVTVVDDESTGASGNLTQAQWNERLTYVRASVENEQVVQSLAAEVDEVYHLAAAVGVQRIVDDPVGTITTNIRGTEIVLDLANNAPVNFTLS